MATKKRGRKAAPMESSRSKTKVPEPEKPLRPAQCRAFMRKHLAGAFPKIVEGFVNQAETGSCMHVKLASELLESKRKASGNTNSRKDSALDVLREWKRRTGKV